MVRKKVMVKISIRIIIRVDVRVKQIKVNLDLKHRKPPKVL